MQARIDRVTGAVNTWIVGDDEEVIVVDPGEEPDPVLAAVGDREVLAVVCTHGHQRHAAAARAVAEPDEAPVALHPADRLAWREMHAGGEPDIDLADGGTFEVADVRLEVVHAPGHTPGSICLYSEELGVLLAGDAVGPGGPVPHRGVSPDFAEQLSSIGAAVLTLDPDVRILPGHGDEFTVATAERRFDSWAAAGPEGPGGGSAD